MATKQMGGDCLVRSDVGGGAEPHLCACWNFQRSENTCACHAKRQRGRNRNVCDASVAGHVGSVSTRHLERLVVVSLPSCRVVDGRLAPAEHIERLESSPKEVLELDPHRI
jgi:hypothetical protein